MKRIQPLMLLAALCVAVPFAQARNYIVVGHGNKLPASFNSAVQSAGGSVLRTMPELGVAVVAADRAGFAADASRIAGVQAVLPDIQWRAKLPVAVDESRTVSVDDAAATSHQSVFNDSFSAAQWNLDAVDAAGAWTAGFTGAGVRVAVLDSGIASGHVDLAPALNTALSTSFVPGEAYDFTGTGFNHGTHVAGIIAARANGIGTVGVAPDTEIVAVKVLSAVTGSGSFSGIINGIYYATSIGAKVINMSLGAEFPRHGFMDDNGTPNDPSDDVKVGANEITALVNALSRATSYAYQRGVTVVVSAGNDAFDRDHDADMVVVPADCTHVLSISATGPVGWSLNPSGTFLDNLSSYSNYGQSRIDFAAPGGDFIYPGNDVSVVGPITQFTWVFDMVFAPSNRVGTSNRYSWSAGTSMAAPHVSAIAALIIQRNGGSMHPAAVAAALRASSDDLGKPGNDDAYGAGRVNAARAVTR